ncbi:hypothetical protein [Aestuariibacter salexigens]|uniref:hypothetical protein n=1 Tax=Aestuariibacter salexigens TaxID=226010 RepID=UPI000405FBCF|nr:hypothetical protein [Aestuariibacter salexigens]
MNAIPCIIDVEASGFGSLSFPIEVGVALPDGKRFCSLIKPQPDWQFWQFEAQALHGITRELLDKQGRPVIEVCQELNQLLAGKTVYSDGWVVDQPWLITLFHAAQHRMAFTVSPLDMILTETQMSVWHSVKQQLIEQSSPTRHRASADAALIQQTWMVTRDGST